MSDTFRIGKEKYIIPKPGKATSKTTNAIRKLSKELEVARAEGKYARQATNVASVLPKEAYKVIENYLKQHNRKIYGGTALNMYLPTQHKIYKRKTLPDYDFFSPDPWVDAVEISDLLYKAGYKFTESKAGIHKGTFKVFADFWPVADITYLPPDLYEQVTTTKKNGYTIVSPAFLQMTLYDIISKPIESPVRWPKVAFRQKLLEEWAPPKFRKKQCKDDFITAKEHVEVDPELQKALDVVYHFARKNKLIHTGAVAYNKYVSIAGGDLRLPVYYYELLAEDAGKYAAEFEEAIKKVTSMDLVPDVYYQPYKDMNKMSYILYMVVENEHIPIFFITELTRCIPYKFFGGRYYCSIDYLFYELYTQMFFENTNLHSFNVSCLIRYLYYVQQKYYKKKNITELSNSPLQRFVTKCRGPYVDVVREEFYSRWVDRAKTQSQTMDIFSKGDTLTLKGVKGRKIRVYPRELIDTEECRDLSEDECGYPCTWSKDINKCTGIPVTGYQPCKGKQVIATGGETVDVNQKKSKKKSKKKSTKE